ncbi:hypothetical protein FIBSPDRAFT_894203 [Athelia psychrophila]|uniref:Uncharacterized protein n=1 Tax=Athelia psychrophila TaxID=1759441 RepID=A0A166G446_9AGAM|nr:hypothetical protein FIBSPDRAFT_894203 [Fibularhizoctonia sp. CBS 109695]
MSNTADRQFKKTEQVVGRPAVTDHNIHEDYMRDPPNNLAGTDEVRSAARNSQGLKEGTQIVEDENPGVIGHQDMGRAKQSDVLDAQLVIWQLKVALFTIVMFGGLCRAGINAVKCCLLAFHSSQFARTLSEKQPAQHVFSTSSYISRSPFRIAFRLAEASLGLRICASDVQVSGTCFQLLRLPGEATGGSVNALSTWPPGTLSIDGKGGSKLLRRALWEEEPVEQDAARAVALHVRDLVAGARARAHHPHERARADLHAQLPELPRRDVELDALPRLPEAPLRPRREEALLAREPQPLPVLPARLELLKVTPLDALQRARPLPLLAAEQRLRHDAPPEALVDTEPRLLRGRGAVGERALVRLLEQEVEEHARLVHGLERARARLQRAPVQAQDGLHGRVERVLPARLRRLEQQPEREAQFQARRERRRVALGALAQKLADELRLLELLPVQVPPHVRLRREHTRLPAQHELASQSGSRPHTTTHVEWTCAMGHKWTQTGNSRRCTVSQSSKFGVSLPTCVDKFEPKSPSLVPLISQNPPTPPPPPPSYSRTSDYARLRLRNMVFGIRNRIEMAYIIVEFKVRS